MPKGSKVERCVKDVVKSGKKKEVAIPICQKSTGLSYKTGKKPKGKKK